MQNNVDDIQTYTPSLRRFAYSLSRNRDLAEDLVQDCVVRAIERIDKFENGTNLRAWLFAIMRNIYFDGLRRSTRGPSFSPMTEHWESYHCMQPVQLSRVEFLEFSIMFENLPARDREILLFVAVEGLEYAEIAQRLGIKLGTVKSRISRARARLRAFETGASRVHRIPTPAAKSLARRQFRPGHANVPLAGL